MPTWREPGEKTPAERAQAERAFEQGLLSGKSYLRTMLSLEPIAEVLQSGDTEMRVAMVTVLAERADVSAYATLNALIADPDETVRTHAAQALAVIDARKRERIRQAERQADRDPSSAERWHEVGGAYLELARLKASLPILCDHYLQQAITALRRALQFHARIDSRLLSAEALELGGELEQAEANARQILDRDPFHVPALLLLARVSYRRGHLADTRYYCQRLATVPRLDPSVEEMVAFWTSPWAWTRKSDPA